MEEWLRYQEVISKDLHEIHEKVTRLRIEVAELKIKASVWGVIGGCIPVAIMIAIEIFLKK